jgi:probable DNA metabolism protein
MISIALSSQTDVAGWRSAARRLRQAGIPPDGVSWRLSDEPTLFGGGKIPPPPEGAGFTAPKELVSLAANALLNRAGDRWDLMYRILWRLREETNLLRILTDPDVDRALGYQKAVFQATHKMHAYVRFRRVDQRRNTGGALDTEQGEYDPFQEEYAAWFEPPHYVLEKGIDFFVRRMANVQFSILTPHASAWWDREVIRFGPGADTRHVPPEDAKEGDWKIYFANIFNPARLNPRAMSQHMARHYWRNLPEAALIPVMIETAGARAAAMVAAQPTQPSERALKIAARREIDAPADSGAAPGALTDLTAGIQLCRRCELWRDATQAVAGEGPGNAAIMFVGEQPGDMEDLSGRPFVGPAGELFNQALVEAGIDRETTYVTNAVKHFKHELRGKRRIHKTPAVGEVKACRWWLENEQRLVKPKVIVALGATAAFAVLRRPVSVLKARGVAERLDSGAQAFVTVHPSYLLRLPTDAARRTELERFVDDLKAASGLIA